MARNCRFPDLETYGSQPGNQRLPLQGIAGSQKLEFMFSKLSNYHWKELRIPKVWNSWLQAWKSNVTSGRICWFQKKIMVLNVVFLFTEPVTEPFVFLNGPVAECLRLAVGPAQKCFCTKKVHVKMIWKQFLYNFMVLLNGPVKNALFCLMDPYRNVCVWFMARNCRFPKVGTHGCQRGNHRLPLQGPADSHRLEVMVPNLGTRGYHCKQLPVTRGWNSCFPTWEP